MTIRWAAVNEGLEFVQQKNVEIHAPCSERKALNKRQDWSVCRLVTGCMCKTLDFPTSDTFREEDRALWTGGLSFQRHKVWNVLGD